TRFSRDWSSDVCSSDLIKVRDRDKHIFLEEMDADLNKLDKVIDDLEPELRLPVLIKKYIKQNAKVISFNVDPKFNDAIDGLMYKIGRATCRERVESTVT